MPAVQSFTLPESLMPIHQAVTARGDFCPLEDAVGKISGEYVWAYPPDTPLLVPGEVIDEGTIRAIRAQKGLRSGRGKIPQKIFCIDVQDKLV